VDQTNWHQWFGTQLLIAVDNSSTSIYKWDADKYENLATWLYNNYVQASKIIDEETLALEHAMPSGKTLFPEIDFAHLSHLREHSMCTLGSIGAN